jgi:medium-chain acyl-[acyl-carrier-protein] hydrolase
MMSQVMTSSIRSTTPWIVHSKPNPYAELRLFCFPYAGGSALVYRQWQHVLPATIEICPVQLPGRGARLHEPPFKSLGPLVESIARALFPYVDKPFAFFGHSMGAIIIYELARLLRAEGHKGPEHLFVSGRRAPHLESREPPLFNLPDAEFFQELRRLGGTPTEVLEHPELMQIMEPLLRADFSVAENYVHSEGEPLDCPITVFGGLQDEFTNRDDLEGWRRHTSAPCTIRMFNGGHFFLNTAQPLLLRVLGMELHQLASRKFGS